MFMPINILFGMPWLLWGIELLRSARNKDWLYHALVGNMALKACVAVPLARVFSAAAQQCGHHALRGLAGYYTGIAAASVLVGSWQAHDLFQHMRSCKQAAHQHHHERTSGCSKHVNWSCNEFLDK